ncbi:hypothetical protein [Sphingomonas glacialis]|uniref:hypothetical protein n=1 Tax=Sphingomonas glacialis TaxID=658225 RepID=UPI0016773A01|nr:hypothetical protein [Sphingomonas glacialis]
MALTVEIGERQTLGDLAFHRFPLHRREFRQRMVLREEGYAFLAHRRLPILDQRADISGLEAEVLVRHLHRATAIRAAAVQHVAELLFQQAAQSQLVLPFKDVSDARGTLDPGDEIVGDAVDPSLAVKRLEHRLAIERGRPGIRIVLWIDIDRIFAGRWNGL